MSKRKNRSASPNLPKEALERARRQVAEERGEVVEQPVAAAVEVARPEPAPPPAAPAPRAAAPSAPRAATAVTTSRATSRRRTGGAEGVTARSRRGEPEVLDREAVRERMRHPTKLVSTEELRQQYGYVTADLRRTGVLAVGLMAALIIVAQLLSNI